MGRTPRSVPNPSWELITPVFGTPVIYSGLVLNLLDIQIWFRTCYIFRCGFGPVLYSGLVSNLLDIQVWFWICYIFRSGSEPVR